jgi:hypothetical protein
MADYTQIIDLADDKLTTLHKNLHGDIEDSAAVEAHHLVTTEMARRGLEHGHIDDAWAFAQVEVDRVESIDLENVTTELSDELAIEVAKTIGISGDVKVVLGVNGYEMQIEKSQDEIDDLEFDVLAGDVEKTIRRSRKRTANLTTRRPACPTPAHHTQKGYLMNVFIERRTRNTCTTND